METIERSAMKSLSVIIALTLATTALAEDEINKTIDADSNSAIRVTNVAGDVEIEGWSRDEVEVEAELGSGVEELIFERDGKEIRIEVKGKKDNSRNISADLVIKVPKGSSLEVGTVSADIVVDGVEGRMRLQSVSGDVEASVFGEDINAESVSGDVELSGKDLEIRVQAKTVSGDVDLENLKGVVDATAVSGDLTVTSGNFSEAKLNTVNGDIIYQAGLYGESRMDVETVNGSVDILFDGDVSARFDVETFNGDVDNCFGPKSERTSKYAPGRELKFTEGGGNGRVVIRTLNGDLTLCKE
jgi:DUF4097 and DUF4098 domain-containing protein YvlB